MKLGTLAITPAIDGVITGAPATGFPGKTEADWEPYKHFLTDDGMLTSQVGSFVVRTGERVILIDAGGGSQRSNAGGVEASVDDQLRELFQVKGLSGPALDAAVALALTTTLDCGELPSALAAQGIQPADVTDVVLTHLHSDHIGWVSDDGTAYFPNATYRCAQADLDYFLGPDVDEAFSMLVWGSPSARDRIAPALDQFEPWDGDANIAPGVDVQLTPGHTPGSSVVVLSSGTMRALVLGDMVHCPIELQDEQWQCIGDLDPVMARRVRDALAREVAGDGSLVAGSHFPGLQFGRLLPGEGRRGWVFS